MLSCLVVSYTQRPSGFKAIIKSIFKTNFIPSTHIPSDISWGYTNDGDTHITVTPGVIVKRNSTFNTNRESETKDILHVGRSEHG